jgi:hypothetical protein
MEGYDAVPVQELEAAVEEWRTTHDPLPRSDLQHVMSRFMRSVGEPARMDTELAREKNPHMRRASAEALGIFAYEVDVALVELDDEVKCGEMIGYPAGDNRWVPLLICLPGPSSAARRRMEQVISVVQGMADGDIAL